MNLHEPAMRVHVTKTVEEADADDYDALLIPGGFINPDLLRQSAAARDFVIAFDVERKPIASLCHGPWLLASAGVIEGRVLTAWPGIRDDVVNAGATWVDRELVRDGNLVTSRGPQDLVPFVKGMIELFAEDAPVMRNGAQPRVSSPQRNEPPALMINAMRWLPRPSVRALALGAIAIAVIAAIRRRRGLEGIWVEETIEPTGVFAEMQEGAYRDGAPAIH